MSSSSRVSFACCSPATSFSYSSCSFCASVFLILASARVSVTWTYSSILSPILFTLLAADSSIGLVKSIERDSIQTLSDLSAAFRTRPTDIVRLVKNNDTLLAQLG